MGSHLHVWVNMLEAVFRTRCSHGSFLVCVSVCACPTNNRFSSPASRGKVTRQLPLHCFFLQVMSQSPQTAQLDRNVTRFTSELLWVFFILNFVSRKNLRPQTVSEKCSKFTWACRSRRCLAHSVCGSWPAGVFASDIFRRSRLRRWPRVFGAHLTASENRHRMWKWRPMLFQYCPRWGIVYTKIQVSFC